ncbi:MAG: hypothetical protein IJ727_11535 [Treponema sp.]|nr:hypothetical protein [Treponema sp.]
MKTFSLEELPQAVSYKILTKHEAADIIWAELYTNPGRYGLGVLDEDEKSDLLLYMRRYFETIFDHFIPGTVQFKTYVIGCVLNYRCNFKRFIKTRQQDEDCLEAYLTMNLDDNYTQFSPEDNFQDFTSAKPKTGCKEGKTFEEIKNQESSKHSKKLKRIAELTAIILLLKACNDISDEQINSVCKFTGVSKELLHEAVMEMKKKTEKKNCVHNKLVEKRNNAFFFHRKYMYEMMTKESTPEITGTKKLREKYNMQTKKWKKHNRKLAIRSATPSNEEIGKLLGLNTRTVSYYISHVKDEENRKQIEKIFFDNDN